MTHRYYYIEESGALICEGTRFYLVAVGQSKQGDRDCRFLQEHAAKHQHFFEKDSNDVTLFVNRIREHYPTIDTQCILVPARCLVRHFKAGTRPSCPQHVRNNRSAQLALLDLNYRCQSAIYLNTHGFR